MIKFFLSNACFKTLLQNGLPLFLQIDNKIVLGRMNDVLSLGGPNETNSSG